MERRDFFKLAAASTAAGAALPYLGKYVAPQTSLKLGKAPAQPHLMKIKLGDYVSSKFPTAPLAFGHYGDVKAPWGVMANDQFGCCVWSGAGHEHMILSTEGGHPATFTDAAILQGYHDVTGFNPFTGDNDRGTKVLEALDYRIKTGLVDTAGVVHKLEAHAAIAPRDLGLLADAAYSLSCVAIGIEMPKFAMSQFYANSPWDVQTANADIQGGHYVPIVGRLLNGNFLCVTWGRLQEITPEFLLRYCDEAHALFTREFLTGNKSPEGFDGDALLQDVRAA